jgi:lysophospholipase L1-like esterase
MTVVAALGDSLTCGEGVGVRVDPTITWAGLLAGALPNSRLVRLASAGSRARDVRLRQLPELPDQVDVATLLVGLNDVARAGFDAAAVRADLLAVVAALRTLDVEVLLARLHDPVARLPMPPRVAGAARVRVAAVNAAVDVAASWPGVRVLDLALVPALSQPGGWSVDRVHPSAAGHQGIAAAAIRSLLAGGRHHPAVLAEPVIPPGPARLAQGWWTVRHGLPYAASHLRELGGPVAACVLHRD